MKELPKAFCDLPAELFPVSIEAFHPKSKAVVWTKTVEQPPHGQKIVLHIPPLREILGHPVSMRLRFGNGMIEESGPVYKQ